MRKVSEEEKRKRKFVLSNVRLRRARRSTEIMHWTIDTVELRRTLMTQTER